MERRSVCVCVSAWVYACAHVCVLCACAVCAVVHNGKQKEVARIPRRGKDQVLPIPSLEVDLHRHQNKWQM